MTMQEPTMNRKQEVNAANPDVRDYKVTDSAPASSTAMDCDTADMKVDNTNTMEAGEERANTKEVYSAEAVGGEPFTANAINLEEPSMKIEGIAEEISLATAMVSDQQNEASKPDDTTKKHQEHSTKATSPSTEEPRPYKTRDPHKDVLLQIYREVQAENLSLDTPRMTPTELAEENENFLGKCVYYHMDNPDHRKEITGDYIIVYTRPLKSSTGELDDTYTTVYQLASADRIIKVRGEPFHTPPTYHPDTRRNWGQAKISVNKQKLLLHFGELPTHSNEKTLIICSTTTEPGSSQPNDFLESIIHKGVNHPRIETSFGLKTTRSEVIGREMYYWGFYFIEIKLPFFNTETGEDDEQLIIGAKLPYTNHYRDISNTMLLKQGVYFPDSDNSYTFVDVEPKSKTKLRALYQASGKGNGEESYKGKEKEEDSDMGIGEVSSEAKGKKRRKYVWRPMPAEEKRPTSLLDWFKW